MKAKNQTSFWQNENSRMWDLRFLELAKLVGSWSKDPSSQVGAVVVDVDKRIISLGYNGFPKGIKDDVSILNNRDEKYKRIIHAERNAVLFAKRDLTNTCIYTYPFMPCTSCTGLIIQAGISRVVSVKVDEKKEYARWKDDFELSRKLFKEANVKLKFYSI